MSDEGSMLMNGGIATAITVGTLIVARVVYPLFTAANHHRIRTVCCGTQCVSSFDVEETTPQARPAPPEVVVDNPMPQTPKARSLRDVVSKASASKLDQAG